MTGFSRMSRQLLMCSYVSLLVAVGAGIFGVLFYTESESTYGALRDAGYTLQQFRPLHTAFVTAWFLLAAAAMVYTYLGERFGTPTSGDRARYHFHMYCWMVAGLGILVTTLMGVSSGREYLGFHPIFSVFILAGWVSFGWTFFSKVWRGFFSQPVYVFMWGAAIPYFAYTFTEGHAYLLDSVGEYPLRDLAIQWKHCGTAVGAFNHMVYGSMFYFVERLTGDKRVAHSWKSFMLFAVGLLNSFSNFGHHTYHLPGQDMTVKYISFGVSMLEVIFIFTILLDVFRILKSSQDHGEHTAAKRFANLSVFWNGFLMPVSILISVPFLNSYIHGTHLVLTHAMGSEIAIDTYLLFACSMWLLVESAGLRRDEVVARLNSPMVSRLTTTLNVGLIGLISFLFVSGAVDGWCRYYNLVTPEFVDNSKVAFAIFGMTMAVGLIGLVLLFLKCLHREKRVWVPPTPSSGETL